MVCVVYTSGFRYTNGGLLFQKKTYGWKRRANARMREIVNDAIKENGYDAEAGSLVQKLQPRYRLLKKKHVSAVC